MRKFHRVTIKASSLLILLMFGACAPNNVDTAKPPQDSYVACADAFATVKIGDSADVITKKFPFVRRDPNFQGQEYEEESLSNYTLKGGLPRPTNDVSVCILMFKISEHRVENALLVMGFSSSTRSPAEQHLRAKYSEQYGNKGRKVALIDTRNVEANSPRPGLIWERGSERVVMKLGGGEEKSTETTYSVILAEDSDPVFAEERDISKELKMDVTQLFLKHGIAL